jgi:uncharacterized protein (DUF1800 family)
MAAEVDRLRTARILHRVGLGPRPGQFTSALRAAPEVLVDSLLADGAADPGVRATPMPALAYLGRRPPAGSAGLEDYRQAERRQREGLKLWWLDRMAAAHAAANERLTWFWHGHWATSDKKVTEVGLMARQNGLLRAAARGPFADLARAMVADAALIQWLDGQKNKAGQPNENLAREFMELFTVGVGNYSENDVREAARALTGWRLVRPDPDALLESQFDGRRHDAAPVTVLGTTARMGAEDLATLLASRPQCPEFLAGRLWFRLVSSSAPMPAPVRARVVAGFGADRRTDGALRALILDPEFVNPTHQLVKSPVEWFVGSCRSLSVTPSAIEGGNVLHALSAMGQVPFQPPSVGGWPAGAGWLTTVAAQKRLALATRIVASADLRGLAAVPPGSRATYLADLLGVVAFNQTTVRVLADVSQGPERVLALALISPEYVVGE